MAQRIATYDASIRPTASEAAVSEADGSDGSVRIIEEESQNRSGPPEKERLREQAEDETQEVCSDCGGALVTGGSETYCSECGLVSDSDTLRRKRTPKEMNPHDAVRCGGSGWTETLHDHGMGSEVGLHSDLRNLSSKKRNQMYRLRRHQSQSRFGSTDRRRAGAFGEIKRLTAVFGLPDSVTEQACVLYRRAHDDNLLQGRTSEWFAAASVFAACRCNNLVRTTEEIAQYARCNASGIQTAYRKMNISLELEAPPISPEEYIPRFASALDASHLIQGCATEIAGRVHDAGLDSGRAPSGVAAACLYLAADEVGEKFTQVEIGDVADVSSGTVRSSAQHITDNDFDVADCLEAADPQTQPKATDGDSVGESDTGLDVGDASFESESTTTEPDEPNARGTDTAWRPSIQIPLPGLYPDPPTETRTPAATRSLDSTDMTDNNTEEQTIQESLIDHGDTLKRTSNTASSQTGASPDTNSQNDSDPDTDPDTTTMSEISFSSNVTDEEVEIPPNRGENESTIRLHSKRRKNEDGPDTFRFWIRVPEELVTEGDLSFPELIGDGDEDEDAYVQITFADGEEIDSGEDMKTVERDIIEGVPGIYLQRVSDDESRSELKYARKVDEDNLGFPVSLPPKIITEPTGLGIDGDTYTEGSDLYFEPVVRDGGVVLVPVGYNDGAVYERPEIPAAEPEESEQAEEDPTVEWRLEDDEGIKDLSDLSSQSLPEDLVPLIQQERSDSGENPSYSYDIYLQRVLNAHDTEIEPGDRVQLAYDDGRTPEDIDSKNSVSRYDESFNPAFFIQKVEVADDAGVIPGTRKIQSSRNGAPVSVPPQHVSDEFGLALREEYYDSNDNPLLLEVTVGEDSIMLTPAGYKDGTPYPVPRVGTAGVEEREVDLEDESEPTDEENDESAFNPLGRGRYLEGTPIRTSLIHDAAKRTDLSANLIAAIAQAIETLDPEDLDESGLFRDDYPGLSLSSTNEDRGGPSGPSTVRVEFLDQSSLNALLTDLLAEDGETEAVLGVRDNQLSAATIEQNIGEVRERMTDADGNLDEALVDALTSAVGQIHSRQTRYYMDNDVPAKQRRFINECAALVFFEQP